MSELSALGFTLAAIEAQLARLPAEAGADELALHRALLTPWVPEQVEELTGRRAGAPRGPGALSPSDLDALEGLGVITPDGGRGAAARARRCSARGSR